NNRLLETLAQLRDMGNTVLVVEHDAETIERADYVIDLGPGAGRLGGVLVAQGAPAEIAANPESLTGRYLSGDLKISIPEEPRTTASKASRISIRWCASTRRPSAARRAPIPRPTRACLRRSAISTPCSRNPASAATSPAASAST